MNAVVDCACQVGDGTTLVVTTVCSQTARSIRPLCEQMDVAVPVDGISKALLRCFVSEVTAHNIHSAQPPHRQTLTLSTC